jgi:hypothetical protein
MRRRMVSVVMVTAVLAGVGVLAQNGTPINPNSKNVLTLAVYGDSPYGANPTDTSETDATPAFIRSINADPKVDLVLHVGDIHSGHQYCTEAYDRTIFDLWTAFKNPLIYTPGDNEWTDCHKPGEGGHVYLDSPTNSVPVDYEDGNPAANLELIRDIFFANPGYALGGRHKRVLTQAQSDFPSDHSHNLDYVENVMWEQSQVLFVTINLPGGSNDDADNWYKETRTQEQTDEIARRDQADLDWLDAAFAQAAHDKVQGVVIALQADMWDRDGNDASHLSNYEQFVQNIATHTTNFAKPVLLFNGDSHHYRSDNPLKEGQPCVFEAGTGSVDCYSIPDPGDGTYTQDAWTNHSSSYDVSNFHRVVVHGSTFPLEWIRLTITPGASVPAGANAFGPFSWQRVIAVPAP